jgi:hypothetical protein
MDDMIADIGREYDLGSGEQHPPPEVQNLCRLLVVSDEKVHRWHRCDRIAGSDISYGNEIEVQFLESMLQ